MVFFDTFYRHVLADPSQYGDMTTFPHLLMAMSKELDGYQGYGPRCSIRVAWIAARVAYALDLPYRDRVGILYASLLQGLGWVSYGGQCEGDDEAQGLGSKDLSNKDLSSENPSDEELLEAEDGAPPPVIQREAVVQLGYGRGCHPLVSTPWCSGIQGNGTHTTVIESPLALEESSSASLRPIRPPTELFDYVRTNLHGWLSQLPLNTTEAIRPLTPGALGFSVEGTIRNQPVAAQIIRMASVLAHLLDRCSGLRERTRFVQDWLGHSWCSDFSAEVQQAFFHSFASEEQGMQSLKLLYSLEVEPNLVSQCPGTDPKSPSMLSPYGLYQTLKTMGDIADSVGPPYFQGHSQRVAQTARAMAEMLGVDGAQAAQVYCGGWVSSLGRVIMNDELLCRTSHVHRHEMDSLHMVPHYGEGVVRAIPGFGDIAQWVADMYERLNAKGYPAGKKSTQISAGGRVLGLANQFVALTSPRPYRPHVYDSHDALALLERGVPYVWDKHLFQTLQQQVSGGHIPHAMV